MGSALWRRMVMAVDDRSAVRPYSGVGESRVGPAGCPALIWGLVGPGPSVGSGLWVLGFRRFFSRWAWALSVQVSCLVSCPSFLRGSRVS